jgi:hypothetical protein
VIELVRVGKGMVAIDRTNRFGQYRFDRRIRTTQRMFTRFSRTANGVHPDIRVCLASRSDTIRIRVQA